MEVDTARAEQAPDFGPWQVKSECAQHAEYHYRSFTKSNGYRPRFYVIDDRNTGGYEVNVEGPAFGAVATVRHVPELKDALAAADACGRAYGWTLATSEIEHR